MHRFFVPALLTGLVACGSLGTPVHGVTSPSSSPSLRVEVSGLMERVGPARVGAPWAGLEVVRVMEGDDTRCEVARDLDAMTVVGDCASCELTLEVSRGRATLEELGCLDHARALGADLDERYLSYGPGARPWHADDEGEVQAARGEVDPWRPWGRGKREEGLFSYRSVLELGGVSTVALTGWVIGVAVGPARAIL